MNLLFLCAEIYEGNYTQELGPDVQLDFPDTHSMEIGKQNQTRCAQAEMHFIISPAAGYIG